MPLKVNAFQPKEKIIELALSKLKEGECYHSGELSEVTGLEEQQVLRYMKVKFKKCTVDISYGKYKHGFINPKFAGK